MRDGRRHRLPERETSPRVSAIALVGMLLAGCSTNSPPSPIGPAPLATTSGRLVPVPIGVSADLAQAPLDQPNGTAFAASTVHVAESEQIGAYDYADGRAIDGRIVAAGLPDRAQPRSARRLRACAEERGPRARQRSVFLDRSTANITPQDRTATPPRATIMRIPPGGGPAGRSRGVCATEPASLSRRTACCARRSTTATMRLTRTATSTSGTSMTTRQSHSAPPGLAFTTDVLPRPYRRHNRRRPGRHSRVVKPAAA